MKGTVGNFIKENYPQSYSIIGMPLFGIALLTVNVLKLSDIEITDLILQIFTYFGLFLLGLFVLIVALETTANLFSPLKKIITIFLFIPKILFTAYIFIVKVLIRNSVVSILEEKGDFVSEDITLRKRGTDKDDDYWGKLINFNEINKLELVIQPSSFSDYWRLGFKFSQNEVFTSARYGRNFPLFHLTKDEKENLLKFHYYDETGLQAAGYKIIMKDYKNDKVVLKVEVKKYLKEVIEITVINSDNKIIFQEKFPLALHKYAQLFAWADRRDYELNIKNYIQN